MGGFRRRVGGVGWGGGVTVYDDFAHHPTAIDETLRALRSVVGRSRVLAVIEPRSNTMKLGVMKARLPAALQEADVCYCLGGSALGWDAAEALAPLGERAKVGASVDELVSWIVRDARPGDHVLVMSNGGFGGIHGRLLQSLGRSR